MTLLRRHLVVTLVTITALAVGVPAAGAAIAPTSQFSIPTAFSGLPAASAGGLSIPAALPVGATLPVGGCNTTSVEGQGRTGGNATQSCVGAGLSFIGPSSSVSTVIGPTIISPAAVGTTIVSGGNVAIGP